MHKEKDSRGAGWIVAAAFLFYSRIPMPRSTPHDAATLSRAAVLLPVVGFVVGATAGAAGFLVSMFVPGAFAIVAAMATGVVLTGAFHEDGLADTADGIGGGWTVEQKLAIMKDSRTGSYGLIVTVLLQLGVYALLLSLPSPERWTVLAAVHTTSRTGPLLVMACADYLRTDAPNKVGGAVSRQSAGRVFASLLIACIGIAPLFFLHADALLLALLLLTPVASGFLSAIYLRRKLGGYTGDTLGATQQICFLTALVAAAIRLRIP